MKKRYFGLLTITLSVLAALIVGACTSTSTSTPTTTPTTTPPTTPTTTMTTTPTTTTTPTGPTYQALAADGQTLYASTCASCHGANGGGTNICPVVMWGTGSTLGTYNGVTLFTDAGGMLNYMSKAMPLTAPGSLTSQQYNDLLAYILTQGNLVSPSTVFDKSQLSTISIK